jgi:Fe-S cluster assembly iron-binding protein IscA
MNLTEAARDRLQSLLPDGARGFRVEGWMGTCRGSTPILKPAPGPRDGEEELETEAVAFFAEPERLEVLRSATLDYEGGLFGRGLRMTWPHKEGCPCSRP